MATEYPRTVLTEFRVLLDDVAVARLMEMADAARLLPEAMIASLVTALLDDDWHAHQVEPSSLSVH